MWEDEIYYEDEDAAMAAYEAAVGRSAAGDASSESSDDFEPAPSGRHGRPKPPQARAAAGSRRAAAQPRKPRAAPKARRKPSPASRLASSGVESQSDAGNGSAHGRSSAIPTPDIGQLNVSSSGGGGSPAGEPAAVAAMDTGEDDDASAVLLALCAREQSIRARMAQLEKEIAELEKKCGVEAAADASGKAAPIDLNEFRAPEWSVPIRANVMNFEWEKLAAACQFDVILMDPPWQLASQAPTRGVAIAYQQLPDICIESLPIHLLQTSGFIFIWVINNKYTRAFQLMKQWGYTYVDDIAWVKQTVNRRMAKGHGYYLQHAKETCLVGKKGADPPNLCRSVASDVIFSERRGQSQKPEEMYEIIEQLVPGGNYLEIFGRKNNLRDYWVTIGNEL
ncbi:hypothetical protein LPJ61_003723 [Coemansia biformis]|uniref:mRNA m(6)A methyltransferase n=1 Tax=Coemansia biformis TaxID=1286918 RepID=A0A9W7YCA6_9FUNG|nr:hypothetical protein LPJ61_003723 [Coemansia biformis]